MTYLSQTQTDSDSLDLTTGQVLDLLIEELLDRERLDDVSHELGVHVRVPDLLVEHLPDCSLGDHVLGDT